MRLICQVVKNAKLYSGERLISDIGKGMLVYCGFCKEENIAELEKAIKKLCGLRIFADGNGKLNLSLTDIGGQMLFVSNFTLYSDCSKGYRPSFIRSGEFNESHRLYKHCLSLIQNYGIDVKPGAYGEDMLIESSAGGPINIIIDSEVL